MKYVIYDYEDGTILGFEVEKTPNLNDGWVTISDEAYQFVLKNNGIAKIKLKEAQKRLEEFNSNNDSEYCVIDINTITNERKYDLNIIIENTIRKNLIYCNMYIENGTYFELDNGKTKKYTYKIEDQINIEQLLKLVDNGILDDNTGIPIKATEESEYDLLSVSEFKRLYMILLKHKYYQLFYMRQYNKYIRTLTSEIDLHRLQYGMILPDEYIAEINKQIEKFENTI